MLSNHEIKELNLRNSVYLLIMLITLSFTLIYSNNLVYASTSSSESVFLFENGTITGYTGTGGDVIIPAAINNKPVIAIGPAAFIKNSTIESIEIPSSVRAIDDGAFSGCIALKKATISEGVQTIGKSSFKDCSKLLNITIPSTVTSIGDYAFSGIEYLKTVTLMGDAPSLGLNAFKYYGAPGYYTNAIIFYQSGKTGYSNPWNDYQCVINTGEYYFYDGMIVKYLGNEKNLVIPDTIAGQKVTSIGPSAFYKNTAIESVQIPVAVEEIGDGAFMGCTSLKNMIIPRAVTYIGNSAFKGCGLLTNINIPCNVHSIGAYAFAEIPDLESVTFWGDAPILGVNAFNYYGAPGYYTNATLYYRPGRMGFSNAWYGYNCVVANPDKLEVVFADKTGKILKIQMVDNGGSATAPASPTLNGYTFVGWDKNLTSITQDTTIVATYKRAPGTYRITVEGGKLTTGNRSDFFKFDMPITVTADGETSSMRFSHWEIDNQKVSASYSFSFFVPMADISITAVYVDIYDTTANTPNITLLKNIMIDKSNKTMTFTAMRYVPTGFSLVESGVLMMQSNTPLKTALTKDTLNVVRGKIKNTSTNQFYIRKSNIKDGETWYARAYLIYKDNKGTTYVVYSKNTISQTMSK